MPKPYDDSQKTRTQPISSAISLGEIEARRQGVEILSDYQSVIGIAKPNAGFYPNSQEHPRLNIGQDNRWELEDGETYNDSAAGQSVSPQKSYEVFGEDRGVHAEFGNDPVGSGSTKIVGDGIVPFSSITESFVYYNDGQIGTGGNITPHTDNGNADEAMGVTAYMDDDFAAVQRTLKPAIESIIPLGYVQLGSTGVPY